MTLYPDVEPWNFPDPYRVLKEKQEGSKERDSGGQLDHAAGLDIHAPRSPGLLLSIICTLGDSCFSENTLEGMILAGMRGVRVDMKKGEAKDQLSVIHELKEALKQVSVRLERPLPMALIGDLKGPQIITGRLDNTDKISLKKGDTITLTSHPFWEDKGTAEKLFVDYKKLPYLLQPKDIILLDCGRIELIVRGTVDCEIVCDIPEDGEMGECRDVLVRGVDLELSLPTERDHRDLQLMVKEKFDAVCAPAIFFKSSIRKIREVIGAEHQGTLVFVKVENQQAFSRFDEILSDCDGVLVNRGKMALEMSVEKVVQAEKTMVAKAILAGKPIWILNDFLSSMCHHDTPTMSEASDVVSSVLEGIDGIILNEEVTSAMDRSALVVERLAEVARSAEAQIWYLEMHTAINLQATPPLDPAHTVSMTAVCISLKVQAAAILVVTTSGKSAQLLSRYKPKCPIYAVTRIGRVASKLNLWRGIISVHYKDYPDPLYAKEVKLRLEYAIQLGTSQGVIKPGAALVLVNGTRKAAGFPNNIRVVYASDAKSWVNPVYKPPVVPLPDREQEIESYLK